jgi:frataxin-like iron-binding protein CyaY
LESQRADGVVAQVNPNPNDPMILGLQNFSHRVWVATPASGEQRQVAPGRSIKLAVGTKINFGSVEGEIRQ